VIAALGGGIYINYALPNTGPAPEIKIDLTTARIERGRYLANHVTACMDCHSTRNWSLYSGPMVSGTTGNGGELFDEKMGFPGKIYAPNLTPHRLGNWTDGEILKAITTGESKDGRALFPLMAYSRFGKMDKEDIYSIVAYIRTLESLKQEVPVSELNFPVNLINKTMPTKAAFQTRPDSSNTIQYGAYLVNAAGCVDCHSQTDKGQVIAGTEFGGGMEFKFPTGTLRAPNITMHKINGLGSWTREAFVARFKLYAGSNYKAQTVGMSVSNTVMPWTMYAGMKNSDIGAIYDYLKSLNPSANKVVIRTFNR
jgi:hypothetical protein